MSKYTSDGLKAAEVDLIHYEVGEDILYEFAEITLRMSKEVTR